MPEQQPNTEPTTSPEGGAPNNEGGTTPPQEQSVPNGQESNGEQQQPEVNPKTDGQEPKQGNPDNAEAAKWRVKLREQEKQNADLQATIEQTKAEQADMVTKIGKAFGFVKDEDTEQADANKLVEQVTTERDTLQQELKSLRQENALSKALGNVKINGQQVQVDPSLTLAVIKGNGALDGLDPAADDYQAQVAKVVTDAVEAHPQLRVQVAPRSSGNAPTPTNNGDGTLNEDDLLRMQEAGEYEEINKAFAAGRFKFNR